MTHENNNIGGGVELPGSDEQKISEMLSGLKRVEAPKDFDFHLKARLANARPADHRPSSFFPILKYVMPLALFLFVGAGVFFVRSYNPAPNPDIVGQPSTPAIATPAASSGTEPVQPPADIEPDRPQFIASEKPESTRRTSPETRRPVSNRNVPEGGSRDFNPSGNYADKALSVPPTPRTPTGIELNPKRLNEAFKMIEAEAEFEGGSWVVRSVKTSGIADQMGLRAGDKVKAIDGTQVTERTEFPASFSVRTIQVQRGSDTVELGAKKAQ